MLKKSMPSLFSDASRHVFIFASVVMVVTTIPYLMGLINEGEGWYFTGFVFGVEDGNSYIAKMYRGMIGDWLFRTPFTAKPQDGVLVFLPYLLLGKLAGSPGSHVQLVVLFHLFRIGAGIISILATYDFISFFIKDKRVCLTGLIVSTLGGGLGYLTVLFGNDFGFENLPLEFYSPESFGFLSLFGLPHLALARGLFFWGLIYYLHMDNKSGGWITGFMWMLMGFFQPLTIVLGWGVIGIHFLCLLGSQVKNLLYRSKGNGDLIKGWFFRALLVGCISLPIVLYTLIALRNTPTTSAWTAQNIVHSPPPLQYLLAYGLVLPFAIIGAFLQGRSRKPENWFLPAWLILFPFLIYSPFDMQRRLAEGFWVVLIILFLHLLESVSKYLKRGGQIYLLLTLPSTIFLFTGSLTAVLNPSMPLYRPTDEVAAFSYLDENVEDNSIVLCSYETGNALPAWAPLFVVIGHGPESAGLQHLLPRVSEFYSQDTPDTNRKALLKEQNVNYVFWGYAERELGDWYPGKVEYLDLIYSKNEYEIFQVRLDDDRYGSSR
jgi:hypothetical protein